jgi:hypothetical protein
MKYTLLIIGIVLSGLAYGWCIVNYPIVAQIIAGGMFMVFILIISISLFPTKRGQ